MSGKVRSLGRPQHKIINIFAIVVLSKPFLRRKCRPAYRKDIAKIKKGKQRVRRPHRFCPRKNPVRTLICRQYLLRWHHPGILIRIDDIDILMYLKILCNLTGCPVCKSARLRHKQDVILLERCKGKRPPALFYTDSANSIASGSSGRYRTALLRLPHPHQIRLCLAAQLPLILLDTVPVQSALYGILDLP